MVRGQRASRSVANGPKVPRSIALNQIKTEGYAAFVSSAYGNFSAFTNFKSVSRNRNSLFRYIHLKSSSEIFSSLGGSLREGCGGKLDGPVLHWIITSQVTGKWSETFDRVIIGFPNLTFLPKK